MKRIEKICNDCYLYTNLEGNNGYMITYKEAIKIGLSLFAANEISLQEFKEI